MATKRATKTSQTRTPETKPVAAHETLRLSPLDDMELDPENPRLSSLSSDERDLSQSQLLALMLRRFNIDELAESILAAGYQPFDPIIGYRKGNVVVIQEGNRRTTALKLLLNPALAPERERAAWVERAGRVTDHLRSQILGVSVLVYSSPSDDAVEAYVGFRHVTGVLQWPAEEKAKFVSRLVERHGWSYKEIADRIGSYAKHVEKHYVAYQIIRQGVDDDVPGAESMTLGTLMRALQASGIREFLGVEYPADASKSKHPVPEAKQDNFRDFVVWTFGTPEIGPLLRDTRELTKFGKILQSAEALRYLRSAPRPTFDRAWMKSGGERETLVDSLFAAADRLEESVPLTPMYADGKNSESKDVTKAIEKCAYFLAQILRNYESVRREHFGAVDNA